MDFPIYTILNGVLVGVIGVLIFLFLYIKHSQSYWDRRGVPNVPADSIIFGNVKGIMVNNKSFFDKMTDLYRQFDKEPYFGYYEYHYPILVVKDLDLVQEVLVEKVSSFNLTKAVMSENADALVKYNPVIQTGAKWKGTRSLLAGGLTPTKLRTLETIIKTISQDMFHYIDNNPGDIELFNDLASSFTSEMVANYGWGIRSNGFSKKSVIKDMFNLLNFSSMTSADLMFFHPFLSKLLSLRVFPKELQNFLKSISEQASNSLKDGSNNNRASFLQTIINAGEKQKGSGKDNLTVEALAGYMATFYVDGYETTGRMISYILYTLMLYPDMQQTLRKEIIKYNDEVTIEGISKLQYMDKFILEVQRFYPIIVYMGRICTEKCKLGSLDVEPGTRVAIPACAIHFDSNYYDDPYTFDPEHFSEENKRIRHKFAHFTFGFGPRMCLGIRYVLANIKLILFYLLKNYEVIPPRDHPVHKLKHNPASKMSFVNNDPMFVRFKKTA